MEEELKQFDTEENVGSENMESSVEYTAESVSTEKTCPSVSAETAANEEPYDKQGKKKKCREKKKLTKKQKLVRAAVKLLVKIAVLAIAGFIVWQYVGEVFILHDNNMYPHIKDGSLVVTYKLEKPIKGDVVLYEINGELKVGRIVGITDDDVFVGEDGTFTVNGYSPYENVFYKTENIPESEVSYPLRVGEGEYFILNDMRENREDSRRFGVIELDAIHGKVVFMVQHRGI